MEQMVKGRPRAFAGLSEKATRLHVERSGRKPKLLRQVREALRPRLRADEQALERTPPSG